MYVFEELFANRIMWVGVLAWFVAQAIKVLLALIREKRFRYQLFFSLGGMPSSHSAIVSALSASIGLVNGFNSSEFAISFVVAVVVMTVMGLIMGRLMNRPVDSIRTVPQGHVMTVLFLAVDGDVHVGAADTAGHRCLRGYSHPGDQVVHSVEEPLLVR